MKKRSERLAALFYFFLLVVQLSADTPGRSQIRFDLTDSAIARRFKGTNGADSLEGRRVDGADSIPSLRIDDLAVDVTGRQWLIVSMSSTKGPYGGFTFSTTDKVSQTYVFPVVSDNKLHTYNVFIGTEKLTRKKIRPGEFKGTVASFSIIPTWEPGASGLVQSVVFGDGPSGSPSIFLAEYTGAVDCLNRVGRPAPVAVRFRNAGGKPMTGIKVELVSSAPLKLVGDWRGVPERLDPDSMVTIIADMLPLAVGTHDFSVTLTNADGVAAQANGRLIVDPALKDIKGLENLQPGVIPPPNPLRIPGYDVGLFYFPGWSHLNHWPAIPAFIERRPELGYYDEGSPDAADWTIKWAVEHGIAYFNILQYWQGGAPANTSFLENGFLKAKFLPQVEYYLTWSNDGARVGEKDFAGCVRYIIDTCFASPNYKKSPDGRPFVGILNGSRLVAEVGSIKKVGELKTQAEAYARSKGHKGIFWLIGGGGSARFKDDGFEGFFYYNAPMAGTKYPAAPAKSLVEGQSNYWRGITSPGLLTLLPITTGFDHRPWFGKTPKHLRYEFTPALFHQALLDGKKYVDSIGQNTLLIECWGEWGEGSCIGPQAEHGFEKLKAIPRSLAPNEPLRPVVVPRDVGMSIPEIRGIWDESPRPPIGDRRDSSSL